jgi:hypothetical protein
MAAALGRLAEAAAVAAVVGRVLATSKDGLPVTGRSGCRAKPLCLKAVAYPPLSDIGSELRREFQEALIVARSFEDLPGKWQAALLESEANAPDLKALDDAI